MKSAVNTNIIKIDGLSKNYGKQDLFSNLKVVFSSDEINLIIGANGVGKTTFLNCIFSESYNYSEVVNLSGERLFYLFDIPKIFQHQRVISFIKFVSGCYEVKFNQNQVRELLDDVSDKRLYELSTGEKQKVILVSAMVSNAQIVLFDEPTNGLDSSFKKKLEFIFNHFLERKTCVLVSTHLTGDFNGIKKKIFELDDGKLKEFTGHNYEEFVLEFSGVKTKKITDLIKLNKLKIKKISYLQKSIEIIFNDHELSPKKLICLLFENNAEIISFKKNKASK